MNVAVTGASGLLGARLQEMMRDAGWHVSPVGRGPGDGLRWDKNGLIDPAAWNGLDGVVHLAGENIGQRWSRKARSRIMSSRAAGTKALAEGLAALDEPPKWLVSGSAVGWYGDAGDHDCPETAPRGHGFLADVVAAWEAAAEPARRAGIRVVHPRTGIVLAKGGALSRMLLPFKLGMGGPMGSGKQWFPWVHIDDWCRAVIGLAEQGEGPHNIVSPGLCRQKDFAHALGRTLRRPAFMPLPGFVVKLMFGAMGKELLLWGQHAAPAALERAGHDFIFTDPEVALRDVLERPARP